MSIEDLGYSRRPFRVIPDKESSKHWAGTKKLKKEIEMLSRKISSEGPSSIKPIWGWYGAGKTHTLLYLNHILEKNSKDSIVIYTEFSPDLSRFFELYKLIIRTIFSTNQIQKLTDAFKEVYNNICTNDTEFINSVCPHFDYFFYAVHRYIYGDQEDKEIIRKWFFGDRIHLNKLKERNIYSRIEDDQAAVDVLSSIINLLIKSTSYKNLIIMIDEFSRLDSLPFRKKETFQSFFEFLFNSCPNNLHLILAYSSRQADKIRELLTPAMLSRLGLTKTMKIKILETTEAENFITELIRINKKQTANDQDELFPFTEDSIITIVNYFNKKGWILKARNIMEVCNYLFEEYIYEVDDYENHYLDAKFVIQKLNELSEDEEMGYRLKKED
ncbi:MAG: hypothetical protein ACTSQE_07695 [Candidatus Heimdallarchaeaceae archaeon]